MSNRKMVLSIALICIVAITLVCAPTYFKSDINSVDDRTLYAELVAMDGIGPVLAEKVVIYRNEHRPINVNDLDNVQGMGPKKLGTIKRQFK